MDHQKETSQSLRKLINDIISNKMSPEERALLMRDLEEEMDRIREYHDAVELPSEEKA
jgi:UDP:flavonoid glycosyltransferase YjiC (YdhE family)